MSDADSSTPDNAEKSDKGLFDFLDSKFGFWIATTLLVGVWSWGYAAIDRYMHREELQAQRAADNARRDMDVILKVVPLLFATESGQQDLALNLLLAMRTKQAIEKDSLDLVKAVLDARLKAGTASGASSQAQAQAAAIVKAEDAVRVADIAKQPAALPAPAASSQLSDAVLPLRVYLQIGKASDREVARRLQQALSAAGMLAPGIEQVDERRTPQRSDVRYCADKIDPGALDRVQAALKQVQLSAENKALAAKVCEGVRYNHLEVWLQADAQKPG